VAFPERLLGEGEEVVYDLRPHWWTLVGPVLVTAVVVAAAAAAVAAMPAGDLQAPGRLAVVGIAVVLLLVAAAGRVVRWSTTHFVLTTERLIFRSGLLSRYGREIPLERVNDVTFSQSLFERLLGIGDLLVESAGEHGQSTFEDIRHPEAVQLEIYRQMEENDRRRGSGATTAVQAQHHPRPPSVLDDLERLADLRDRGAVTEEEFQAKKRELLDRL
jgi:uncharacterized membrane protein YdbT with pleckstrin-like domain